MTYFTKTNVARSMLAVPGRPFISGALRRSRNPPSLSRLPSSVHSDAAKGPIKTISDLPGPISLPVIGTTWTYFIGAQGESLGKRILKVQEEHADKYGRIFRLQIPGVTILYLSDLADVAKILRSEPKYPE